MDEMTKNFKSQPDDFTEIHLIPYMHCDFSWTNSRKWHIWRYITGYKKALEIMRELQSEYEQEGRGIVIREINGAFQYVTREANADYIERLCTPVKIRRLSQSALP